MRRLYCGRIATEQSEDSIKEFLEKTVFKQELETKQILSCVQVQKNEWGWKQAVKIADANGSSQQPMWKSVCITLTPTEGKADELFRMSLNLDKWPTAARRTVRPWTGGTPRIPPAPSGQDWKISQD